jgi:Leucine-rich repeat (LRR) protein
MKNKIYLSLSFFLIGLIVYSQEKELSFSYRNADKIELDTTGFSNLKSLDLSGNNIKILPSEVLMAKNLKKIKLNDCRQLDLKVVLQQLAKLPIEELEVNSSNITYVPIEISKLSSLKKVSLANNHLTHLPWYLNYLKNIEGLNFANNAISEIDVKLGDLHELKSLNLSYNPVINKPGTMKKISKTSVEILKLNGLANQEEEWTLPPNVRVLELNELKGKTPKKINNAGLIEELSLKANGLQCLDLKELSDAFASKKLGNVVIENNNIVKVSSGKYWLEIKQLEIKVNKMSEATGFANFTKLEQLKLSAGDSGSYVIILNAISSDSLKDLSLVSFPYSKLPVSINNFVSLESIDVHSSKIVTIDSEIKKLKNLQKLDIQNCGAIANDEIEKIKKEHPKLVLYHSVLEEKSNNQTAGKRFINKPIPDLVLPFEKKKVDPTLPINLVMKDGSKINIEPNSIVDANGKPYTKSVDVIYETYKSPEEIFLSGIPMEADSAGQKFNFASAGMFKIEARAETGQQLYLKKGKDIKIDFTSNSPNDSYNFYALDTVKKNWVETGKDDVIKTKKVKPFPIFKDTIKDLNPTKVLYTSFYFYSSNFQKNKEAPEFNISIGGHKRASYYDTIVYPADEFVSIKRYDWQYAGNDRKAFIKSIATSKGLFKNYNQRDRGIFKNKSKTSWSLEEGVEMLVFPDIVNDCYIMRFASLTDSLDFQVIPITHKNRASDIQTANKKMYNDYSKLHKDNRASRSFRMSSFFGQYRIQEKELTARKNLLEAYSNRQVSYEKYMEMYDSYYNNTEDSILKRSVTGNTIQRSFSLQGFGIYNCDYFQRLPNPMDVYVKFKDRETEEKVKLRQLTLIDLNENALVSLDHNHVKLAKNRVYWFFVQDENGQLNFASEKIEEGFSAKLSTKLIKAKTIEEFRKEIAR